MPLRSFERDVVERVLRVMNETTTIITGVVPTSIEKSIDGKLLVTYSSGQSDKFDTVLAAVGRCPCPCALSRTTSLQDFHLPQLIAACIFCLFRSTCRYSQVGSRVHRSSTEPLERQDCVRKRADLSVEHIRCRRCSRRHP